jgi:hypothetical protein
MVQRLRDEITALLTDLDQKSIKLQPLLQDLKPLIQRELNKIGDAIQIIKSFSRNNNRCKSLGNMSYKNKKSKGSLPQITQILALGGKTERSESKRGLLGRQGSAQKITRRSMSATK